MPYMWVLIILLSSKQLLSPLSVQEICAQLCFWYLHPIIFIGRCFVSSSFSIAVSLYAKSTWEKHKSEHCVGCYYNCLYCKLNNIPVIAPTISVSTSLPYLYSHTLILLLALLQNNLRHPFRTTGTFRNLPRNHTSQPLTAETVFHVWWPCWKFVIKHRQLFPFIVKKNINYWQYYIFWNKNKKKLRNPTVSLVLTIRSVSNYFARIYYPGKRWKIVLIFSWPQTLPNCRRQTGHGVIKNSQTSVSQVLDADKGRAILLFRVDTIITSRGWMIDCTSGNSKRTL